MNVFTKRSLQPLPYGSRAKAELDSVPRKRSELLTMRADVLVEALAQRLQDVEVVPRRAAWMPTHSPVQWSTAKKMVAQPSPPRAPVASVPHI